MAKKINNWISGKEIMPDSKEWLEKINPHNGNIDSLFANSSSVDVTQAIDASENSFTEWSELTPVERGNILFRYVNQMRKDEDLLTECVARETGKSNRDAYGEVQGAIAQGEYFAGEGRRLYGRSLTSAMPGKYAHTVRVPLGIAGLIVPANTPIANIAWKLFPALICGNTVVLKASEDAPEIALIMAKLAQSAGIPDGVFNVIQGTGLNAGVPIVESDRVDIISFTGSTEVGKSIASIVGKRMGRVSLELGGKNPLVVTSDADLGNAVHWASLSAFSNAGQRCAAGSKILIYEDVYQEFIKKLIRKVKTLKLGIHDDCDIGPVMNVKQEKNILEAIEHAKKEGGRILCGGSKSNEKHLQSGFYIEPTLIEGLENDANLSCNEIFGPVATLYKVKDLDEAIKVSNASEYGLTAAIHTNDVDTAIIYAQNVKAGVVNINAGTYGSEPHMPFGGFGSSGNGTREPGIEALDVYTETKNISFLLKP